MVIGNVCQISYLLRMLSGHFAHQMRISFKGSATALAQTYTSILPGIKFIVLLSRMVLQDATRAVLDVFLEERTRVYVDHTIQLAN